MYTSQPEHLKEKLSGDWLTYVHLRSGTETYNPICLKLIAFCHRFVTVTRTYTTVSTESEFKSTEPPVLTITPTPASSTSTPLFRTETIPAPENILTSSYPEASSADYQDHFGISPSIETLPAVGKLGLR